MQPALAFVGLLMASLGCLYLVCAVVAAARFGGKVRFGPDSARPR